MKNKPYCGHRSWNYWNVSLWINNDEGLYNLARECIRATDNRNQAARRMIENLPDKTLDNAPYTISAVRAAMVGM